MRVFRFSNTYLREYVSGIRISDVCNTYVYVTFTSRHGDRNLPRHDRGQSRRSPRSLPCSPHLPPFLSPLSPGSCAPPSLTLQQSASQRVLSVFVLSILVLCSFWESPVENAVGWQVAGRVVGEKGSGVNVTLPSFDDESSALGVPLRVIDRGGHAVLHVVNAGDAITAVERPWISADVRVA